VARYSASRDIATESDYEPSTGTKLEIAAIDQIRPIPITTPIPTTHARILHPSTTRVELADRDSHIFRRLNVG